MNGPAKCASGAGAGSAATEPRSRVSSGLGAAVPFHSESRPQRSASGVEDPAGVGGVSTWVTIGRHVGGVFVCPLHRPLRRLCLPRRLQSMHGPGCLPGKRSAQGAPATGGDRDRSGNRRERRDRRLQRIARAEGIARTSFSRQRPHRSPPLPDIGQPHNGWVSTRRAVSSRMRLRSWTRQGPRGSSSRCTTKYLPPPCSRSSSAMTSPTWLPSW